MVCQDCGETFDPRWIFYRKRRATLVALCVWCYAADEAAPQV